MDLLKPATSLMTKIHQVWRKLFVDPPLASYGSNYF